MTEIEIFVCNKAYNETWLEDIRTSNSSQYAVITAIIEVIMDNDGGDITHDEVLDSDHRVADYIRRKKYKIVTSNRQQLQHNGKGIRHAKYAPSKSVAILWENIGGTIYITFDDHAPVRYHRAIHCFRQLGLGKQVFPRSSRDNRRFIKKMKTRDNQKFRGFDLRKRNYI